MFSSIRRGDSINQDPVLIKKMPTGSKQPFSNMGALFSNYNMMPLKEGDMNEQYIEIDEVCTSSNDLS
jgi:hypothetical protein